MQKKNILLIVHCLPYPLNSGGRQAIFNGIKAIKDDYEIFITYPDTDTAQDRVDKLAFLNAIGKNVKLLPFIINNMVEERSFIQKVSCKLIAVLNKISKTKQTPPNPYSYWIEELLPKSKAYIGHICNIIKDYNIDAVQCEMVRNLPLVLSLPYDVIKIFVHHELGFTRHELELESLSSDLYDGQTICNWAKCLEVSLLNKFDHIVTLSSADSQKLRNAGVTTRIHDSFAIVKSSQASNFISHNPLALSFVGPDNHIPNYVGLKWFLDNCWTKLLQADENYHLRIIGKWSKTNIKDISSHYPNVSFMGFVENLESAIQNTIMIVPITIGSGIRMKILEAANLGIPFVSTSVGAEGIPVQSGKHCLLADNPSDFVEAILKLNNHENRAMLILNAHQLIKDNYSLEALRRNRLAIYATIFNK
jgi:glycosyltransferase involved in cell wall biosynthesis